MTGEKILIVEDEEDVMELLRYNLANEGFNCVAAYNGQEALKKARATLPDLVLLDLMLPEVDGLEVCEKLKSNPQTEHIPNGRKHCRQWQHLYTSSSPEGIAGASLFRCSSPLNSFGVDSVTLLRLGY